MLLAGALMTPGEAALLGSNLALNDAKGHVLIRDPVLALEKAAS